MEIIISSYPEGLLFPDDIEATVRLAVEKVGEMFGASTAEVSVTLTNDAYIHTLNKEYRQIDRPTDVLSFALREGEEPVVAGGPDTDILGDIVLSVERARAQATEYGHSLRREIAFLTVHGMLHLLGYDHIEEADRREMEQEQKRVMEALDIPRQ